MAISDLFEKSIDRFIEGVIKADDENNLLNEMEEYIITQDIAKKLHPILDTYCGGPSTNGVWISGFFGSGKSHLLKMLSIVLEKKTVNGRDLSVIFLDKLRETGDEFLVGDMERALKIPSLSILFNIDQKADSTVQETNNHILGVFLKVFNELCGYCGTLPFVAEFERDMDAEGLLEQLKQSYLEQTGKTWEAERHRFHTIRRNDFASVYAKVTGSSEQDATELLNNYRASTALSIEDFAKKILAYIKLQPSGFRLNFFVDEVGQFIAENSQRMLNMQTLAETLSTICGGQAWIFVTSQAALEEVVGSDPGQDFSRIQDRFKVKVNLDGKDVSEVIQQRLLKKKSEAKPGLQQIYQNEQENIRTLFTFGGGTQTYQNIRDENHFVMTYPMLPYQYDLFQLAMMGLYRHGAFTGRHTSVGERSMLSVFQGVLMEIADLQTGCLASFDKMFQGIRQSLKPGYLNLINFAENNLDAPLALRLLRALALVKYIDSFKATIQNLSILLVDQFDVSIVDLQKHVGEALQLLEDEIYIQRNGDNYSYLTDVEKDVEKSIKSTEVSIPEQTKTLSDLIFNEVIQTKQFRFEDNKQHYLFARKIDGTLAIGQDTELAINVISPFHEHFGDEILIKSHSMGKAEMLVLLPEDKSLMADLLMYLKTDRYCKTHSIADADDTERSILREKGETNQKRRTLIRRRIEDLLKGARLIVNNSEMEITGDGVSRLSDGFQQLVRSSYPNLKMLNGHPTYQETDLNKYLFDDTQDLFTSGGFSTFTEAEEEIQTILKQNNSSGERTTFRDLSVQFMKKPYGWPLNTVQCLLAQLYRKGKVDIRFDGSSLGEQMVLKLLPQSANATSLIIRPLEDIDATKLKQLKDFHHDFFKTPNPGSDYRSVIREFNTALENKTNYFKQLEKQQSTYHFLESLTPAIESLLELKNKDKTAFLDDIDIIEQQYMALAEDKLDNIQSFMEGPQFQVYQEIIEYWQKNRDDALSFGSENTAAIHQLIKSIQPWSDTQTAMAALEKFRPQLETKKAQARQKVTDLLEKLKGQIRYEQKFEKISSKQQEEILKPLDDLATQLDSLNSLSSIETQQHRAEQTIYVQQLNKLAEIKIDGVEPDTVSEKMSVSNKDILVKFPQKLLATEEDLEAYLAALKKAYENEIRQNKKIVLS
jgi:predicted transcriptional regulator